MNDDVAHRLEALERHVRTFLPAPLERMPNRFEQPEWVRAMVLARREKSRDEAPMSYPIAGEVRIEGLIDDSMVHSIQDQLAPIPYALDLTVTIDSRGGDFDAAVRAYKAIRWHPAARKTAVLGQRCQSAAVIVALACDRRVASHKTKLLVHGVGSKPDHSEHWSVVRHLEEIRRLAELDAEMFNLFCDRVPGLDLTTIAALAGDEDSTPLADALQLGLIHEVAAG